MGISSLLAFVGIGRVGVGVKEQRTPRLHLCFTLLQPVAQRHQEGVFLPEAKWSRSILDVLHSSEVAEVGCAAGGTLEVRDQFSGVRPMPVVCLGHRPRVACG